MTAITKEGNKLQPDTFIELYDLDASTLQDAQGNSGVVTYITNTPTGGGTSPLLWRGNNYFPVPFEVAGVAESADGNAPSRPTIAISNVDKFLLAAVLTLGDLVGMRVTRWRTFYKFLDGQPDANPLMHYPIQQWTVSKKMSHSRSGIQFEMSSPLDRPGLRLPRKQILRDKGFPGVSRVRAR